MSRDMLPQHKISLRSSKEVEEIKTKLELTKKREVRLLEELAAAKGNQRVVCPFCNKHPRIGDCTFIQTWYYHSPYGCSGGDYSTMDEGRLKCPCCSHETRLYAKADITEMKPFFKEVIDERDD